MLTHSRTRSGSLEMLTFVELSALLGDLDVTVDWVPEGTHLRTLLLPTSDHARTIPSEKLPLLTHGIAQHISALQLVRAGQAQPDPPWPVGAGVGLTREDLDRVVYQFQQAVGLAQGDVPAEELNRLYWLIRHRPGHTAALDLLYDEDGCCEAVRHQTHARIARFEQCPGPRYRVASLLAWEQRPGFWRRLLP